MYRNVVLILLALLLARWVPPCDAAPRSYTLTLTLGRGWIRADGRDEIVLTARLTDRSGHPRAVKEIWFDGDWGWFEHDVRLRTDGTGQARCGYWTTSEGTYQLDATAYEPATNKRLAVSARRITAIPPL